MSEQLKYLDIYVDALGNVTATDFHEESVIQYSNTYVIRILSTGNFFDTVGLNILQPNGVTLPQKQAILQPELLNGYYQWHYRLSQLDTSVVGGTFGTMKVSMYATQNGNIITSEEFSFPIQESLDSEVVIGDPTSLTNIAEQINNLAEDLLDNNALLTEITTEGIGAYLTKDAIEEKLTGDISSHIHDSRYYREDEVDALLENKQDVGDYATLVDGKIPSSQMPSIALTDVSVVSSQSEQDALIVEEGDVVVRTDLNKTFIYNGTSWVEITATSQVVSVNGQTGVVVLSASDVGAAPTIHIHDDRYYTESEINSLLTTKANTVHTHTKSQITDFAHTHVRADITDFNQHNHDDLYYTKSQLNSGQLDTRYYTETETNNLLANKSDVGHIHDDRYYTESETNTLLANKSDLNHIHDDRYYTETELDNGQLDNRYYTQTQLDNGQLDNRYYTETEVNTILSGYQPSGNYQPAGDYATLEDGKIPAAQLPSFVDDVIEAASFSALPTTGEDGKIYVTLDTNLTYRWSGTQYVEISESLALGETSSTAYRGDLGKVAYDHSQLADGSNPHGTTFANIQDKPSTISGYGISDAYTKTELDNGQLDNRYYTETELNNGQLDNRYYTETETNTLLSGKTDVGHTHLAKEIILPIVEVNTQKTLALSDVGTIQKFNNSSIVNLFIPLNTNAEIPVGSEIAVLMYGQGPIEILGESGVTVRCNAVAPVLADQYSSAIMRKVDTDEWLLTVPDSAGGVGNVISVNGQTGVVVLNSASVGALDASHPASGVTTQKISNWDTAFSWGNHASAGYLTSFTELDPVFSASEAASITSTDKSNWNAAYSHISDTNNPHNVTFDQTGAMALNPGIIEMDSGTDLKSIYWNSEKGTFDFELDSGVVLQLGQENHFRIKSNTVIQPGQVVMFAGVQGDTILGTLADVTQPGFKPRYIMGIATSFIDGQSQIDEEKFGYVTWFGAVGGISTPTGWNAGDILYVSPTVPGGLTNVEPTAPNYKIVVAAVEKVSNTPSTTNGILLVRPDFSYNLGDLHDINISSPQSGQVIKYNSVTGRWENTAESDPVFSASAAAGVTSQKITNWDTAHSWGDHSTEGYLTQETDPLFTASPAHDITSGNISNWNDSYSWGNHADEGYLTQESDPVFTSSVAAGITSTDLSQWSTAYSWGDHGTEGYLKSFTETDPTVGSHIKAITTTNITDWNSAYSWGDHALAGYLTETNAGLTYQPIGEYATLVDGKIQTSELPSIAVTNTFVVNSESAQLASSADIGDIVVRTDISKTFILSASPASTLSNWVELLFPADAVTSVNGQTGAVVLGASDVGALADTHPAKDVTAQKITNWDAAHSWGNHATEGYLKSFTELDPVFTASPAAGISSGNISNWNTAYGWGNHASEGYLKTELDPVFSASPAFGITSQQITDWVAAYGWGDHSLVGYLTSETDPIFSASPAANVTTNKLNNWDTAYSWGDHALAGYLTNFTETDPVFTASAASSILSSDISNWNSAYSWGNHALAGYLTSLPNHNHNDLYYTKSESLTLLSAKADVVHNHNLSQLNDVYVVGIQNGQVLKWNATLSRWEASNDLQGSGAGTVTSVNTQIGDVVLTASDVGALSSSDLRIANWDTAYSWGNHNTVGYLTSLPTHNHNDLYYTKTELNNGQLDNRYYTETETDTLLSNKLSTSLKGAVNGLAELDSNGIVPLSQLPSYVDTIDEYANFAALPVTGTAEIIYLTLDDHKIYRWSGSEYVQISPSLALGETSETAYRGDRGKIAYDHSQSTGNPHGLTAGDIGALTSESDPVFTASAASGITSTQITEWNSAYSWGDHSTEGYLTSVDVTDINATGTPSGTTYLRGDGTWATVSGGGGGGTSEAALVNVSEDKILGLTDAGTFQKVSSSSLVTITIPSDSTVEFPDNPEIAIAKYGTGNVSIVGASGVTVNASGITILTEQYTVATIKKIASNEWILVGPDPEIVETDPVLNNQQILLESSITLPLANTQYDLMSTTLSPGTWLINVNAYIGRPSFNEGGKIWLYSGSVMIAHARSNSGGNDSNSIGRSQSIALSYILTVTSSTNIKVTGEGYIASQTAFAKTDNNVQVTWMNTVKLA